MHFPRHTHCAVASVPQCPVRAGGPMIETVIENGWLVETGSKLDLSDRSGSE